MSGLRTTGKTLTSASQSLQKHSRPAAAVRALSCSMAWPSQCAHHRSGHRVRIDDSLRAREGRTNMHDKLIVTAAAWLEIVVGALFLIVPDVLCLLLFGAKPEAIGMLLGRFAGIGLLALGIACLPSRDSGL